MTSKNKKRGNNLERQVVEVFKKAGYKAKRAYASNGESLGLDKEVDVVTYIPEECAISGRQVEVVDLKIQCKKKKKLPEWLGMTDKVDAVVVMEDRGTKYILFPLKEFIERYL